MESSTNASTSPSSRKTKIGVIGCSGRVGRRLCFLASEHSKLELVAAITSPGHSDVGKFVHEMESSVSKECQVIVSTLDQELLVIPDVFVDFSSPNGTVAAVARAVEWGVGMVVGTTGLTAEQEQCLKDGSKKIPIIHAMNFSLGVNLLVKVAATVAAALGEEFNIEIVEAHHNKKVDAPSGTALALADSICASLGKNRDDLVHGRQGQVGQRTGQEIGMHAVRMGSVVGDHTIHFGSEFERVELTHRAQNRDVFASGALRAGVWLAGREAGMYDMEQVLFGEK